MDKGSRERRGVDDRVSGMMVLLFLPGICRRCFARRGL
jgi:hypothetical protein